jgi:hypothetical protein
METIVDTFPTADLIRYGWLPFEDGLRNFTTVQVVLPAKEYARFRSELERPGRHPIAAVSLLPVAHEVIVPRDVRTGLVATSKDSEYAAFVAFTEFAQVLTK